MKRTLLLCLAVVAMLCVGNVRVLALEQDSNGVYQINTVNDLLDFSDLVNFGGSPSANAVLNADLDMNNVTYTPIGYEDVYYTGTFDGQCHYVNNLYIETNATGGESYLGLFGVISGGANIKNLIIGGGDISYIGGSQYIGGVVGGTRGTGDVLIENCGNEALIWSSGANAAGILGVDIDNGGPTNVTIRNCYNTGTIVGGKESCAISGWLGSSAHSVVSNCWNTGRISGVDSDNRSFARGGTSAVTYVNCWDSMCMQSGINNLTTEIQATLSTGEFCFQTLNETETEDVAWRQDLGVDKYPIPFYIHGIVYAVGDLNCDGTSKGDETTYSNEDTSTRDPHNFVDGFCSVCGTIDVVYMTADVDGFYNIGTSADLYWFALYTKTAETKDLNARLTADINYEKEEMIGSSQYYYGGTFDGQGHTITISFIYPADEEYVALFNRVDNAVIENLAIDGVITTNNGRYLAGIVSYAYNYSIISNCISRVHIESAYNGDGTHGGICAIARNSLMIRNCIFAGELNAPLCNGSGGILGWAYDTNMSITNTIVTGNLILLQGDNNANILRVNGDGTVGMLNTWVLEDVSLYNVKGEEACTKDQLTSGEMCYILNGGKSDGVWHQTLGTDEYPIPFDSREVVYVQGVNCGGQAEGDVTYTNTVTTYPEHEYGSDGICVNCHNAYQISNADQLVAFSSAVNGGSTNTYAELLDDIDLAGVSFVAIGGYPDVGGNPYNGTFDGKGHKISNMNINTTTDYQGFFGAVADGVHVKNLVIDNTCSVTSAGHSAGLIGAMYYLGEAVIENCGSEANVTTTGANAAGLLGVSMRSGAKIVMTNCYSTGKISGGNESAAVSGWFGVPSEVTNCWTSCTVNGLDGTKTFYRAWIDINISNCYETLGSQVTNVTADAVKSGELTYRLNNGETEDVVWYQTIGTDEHPVFDTDHGIVYYDAETGTYTNGTATGIEQTVATPSSEVNAIYSVDGIRLTTMQKGINIVRMADGSVRKVFVK